jgi:hypothetical protein
MEEVILTRSATEDYYSMTEEDTLKGKCMISITLVCVVVLLVVYLIIVIYGIVITSI